MADIEQTTTAVANATTWMERVSLIRKIPEAFGRAELAEVYAAIARRVYAPHRRPDFGYVHWRDDYELSALESAYRLAHDATDGFKLVDLDSLAGVIGNHPATLRVFRLLLGFNPHEFSAACGIVAQRDGLVSVGKGRITSMEAGSRANPGNRSHLRGCD